MSRRKQAVPKQRVLQSEQHREGSQQAADAALDQAPPAKRRRLYDAEPESSDSSWPPKPQSLLLCQSMLPADDTLLVLASLPVCQDLKAAEYPYHRHMDIRPTTGCHLVVLRHDLYQSVNLENLAESDLSWGSNWTAVVLMDGHPVGKVSGPPEIMKLRRRQRCVFEWLPESLAFGLQVTTDEHGRPARINFGLLNSEEVPLGSQRVDMQLLEVALHLDAEGHKQEPAADLDAAAIYDLIKPPKVESDLQGSFKQLRPQLRPYQRRAASWMVQREKGFLANHPEITPPQWLQLSTLFPALDPTWHLDVFDRAFKVRLAEFKHLQRRPLPRPADMRGGILACEMGLGKTVELLACILAHPFPGPRVQPELGQTRRSCKAHIGCVCGVDDTHPDAEDYEGLWLQCASCLAWMHGACVSHPRNAPAGDWICQQCRRAQASAVVEVDCGATLIVCPASILPQWEQEIHRHCHEGALKVITYQGQSQNAAPGAGPAGLTTAADLAAADIVLTTYDVLRLDLNRQPQLVENRQLRGKKKYEVIPTCLTRLRWWRVCLDEAQMCDNPGSPVSEMASHLQSVHRWAITGTPMSHDLRDMRGLLKFLRAEPLADVPASKLSPAALAASPLRRACVLQLLHPGLGGLLWRTRKADLDRHELGIPPQTVHSTHLAFSAVERYFYNRQHQECSTAARTRMPADLTAAMRSLNPSLQGPEGLQGLAGDRQLSADESKKLWVPLLRLRQACCHPQVGAGGLRALTASKAPMSMAEILKVLMTKAKVEAEDAQRILLGALNGIAALLSADGKVAEAISAYRQVLATAAENAALVRADPLQRMHTLHNLAELLTAGGAPPPGVARTLRDDKLADEAGAISQEYMVQWVAEMAAAEASFRSALDKAQLLVSPAQGCSTGRHTQPSRAADARAPSPAPAASALQAVDAQTWVLEAVALLTKLPDGGDKAREAVLEQLMERDRYLVVANRNATGMAQRFRDLAGLKLILLQELDGMKAARAQLLQPLRQLTADCQQPREALILQAGSCGRCRGDLGHTGKVCRHCRLDGECLGLEMRLFAVHTRSIAAGSVVTAEEALLQAQAAALRRVGQGGLGEVAGEGVQAGEAGGLEQGRRGDQVVAGSDLLRQPCQAETAMRVLAQQLRQVKHSSAATARRAQVLADEGKLVLDGLEAERKLLAQVKALMLAQRALLYAGDELAMARLRLRVRLEGEDVQGREQNFVLHPAELPVKNKELTMDRIGGEADLRRTLGTLRYLTSLQAEHLAAGKLQAAVEEVETQTDTPAPDAAAASSSTAAESNPEPGSQAKGLAACPICHDVLSTDLMVMPCGHMLCCACCMRLCDRFSSPSKAGKRVACPTCRTRVIVDEINLVRTGLEAESSSSGSAPDEASLEIKGSYSTKVEAVVRRVRHLTERDPTAKVLVFSTWQDLLDVVAHALSVNKVPFAGSKGRSFTQSVRDLQAGAFQGKLTGKWARQMPPGRIQTLLLPVKHGSNGLNLTDAQHVLLVEPLLDPAVQAQAVGRVHRIGQTRPTQVHHFIIDQSVEENVRRLNQERAAQLPQGADTSSAVPRTEIQSLSLRDVALLLQQPARPSGPAEEVVAVE